jgi:hypothetical protein
MRLSLARTCKWYLYNDRNSSPRVISSASAPRLRRISAPRVKAPAMLGNGEGCFDVGNVRKANLAPLMCKSSTGPSSTSWKASKRSLRSSTLFAYSRKVSNICEFSFCPSREMEFHVDFMAYMPLNESGRIELPTVCVTRAMGTCKSPTAAPEPAEEPPGVHDGSCGFAVLNPSCEGPTDVAANSMVIVLPSHCSPGCLVTCEEDIPKISAPRSLDTMTLPALVSGWSLTYIGELYWVGMSLERITSLTPIAMPCKESLFSRAT